MGRVKSYHTQQSRNSDEYKFNLEEDFLVFQETEGFDGPWMSRFNAPKSEVRRERIEEVLNKIKRESDGKFE